MSDQVAVPVADDGVCRRRVSGSDPMGQCCPECWHTDFVHPGRPNRQDYDAERGRVDKLIGHLIGVRHV